MLAQANRLRTAEEFRLTLRKGRRSAGRLLVVSVLTILEDGSDQIRPRFGFVITRKVGNAVVRNRLRRRLKAIARELIPEVAFGTRVVLRVLPLAAAATFTELDAEFRELLQRTGRR